MNTDWNAVGAAMSDKSAIKEYGLMQQEIYDAGRKVARENCNVARNTCMGIRIYGWCGPRLNRW